MKKQHRSIKGRYYADGKAQRNFLDKTDSTLLTVRIEEVFITYVINSKKGRFVAVTDMLGVFLHAKMEDVTYM